MDKKIIINQTAGEVQIAILENNRLVEYFVEKPETASIVGNIYKGEIENVILGIRAAFIDIGHDLNAFLPFSEIGHTHHLNKKTLPDDAINGNKKPRNSGAEFPMDSAGQKITLKTGQKVVVQVVKEPFAQKGPRVTTEISIPGRYVVLVPYRDFVGVSRKIYNRREQRRLRGVIRDAKGKGYGVIIRTAATNISQKDLEEDLKRVEEEWSNLHSGIKEKDAPSVLFQEMKLASTLVRDLLDENLSEISVNDRYLYRDLVSYVKEIARKTPVKLTLFSSRKPIFVEHRIDRVIDKIMQKRVWLPCGGYIVIEHTEALTTIDVNSGKFIGKGTHEENSVRVNSESAVVIAQQLRLRDIGGLVVIDFIDMQMSENKDSVYAVFKAEIRKDRARWAIQPISEFGLLEMTRQRVRRSLLFTVTDKCPACSGTGRVMSKSQIVARIELWLQRFRADFRDRRLVLSVNPDIAAFIKFSNPGLMRRFQFRFFMLIKLQSDPELPLDSFRVYSKRQKKDVTDSIK